MTSEDQIKEYQAALEAFHETEAAAQALADRADDLAEQAVAAQEELARLEAGKQEALTRFGTTTDKAPLTKVRAAIEKAEATARDLEEEASAVRAALVAVKPDLHARERTLDRACQAYWETCADEAVEEIRARLVPLVAHAFRARAAAGRRGSIADFWGGLSRELDLQGAVAALEVDGPVPEQAPQADNALLSGSERETLRLHGTLALTPELPKRGPVIIGPSPQEAKRARESLLEALGSGTAG